VHERHAPRRPAVAEALLAVDVLADRIHASQVRCAHFAAARPMVQCTTRNRLHMCSQHDVAVAAAMAPRSKEGRGR
jgi:hypothetical protein